jgi:predicted RNA-binding protein YlqC (UPF0109 family)
MRDLIYFVAKAIVDNPDEVEVREVNRGRRLELMVADDDLGRIIGRRGRTAQAMRTLLRAAARSRGPVDLEIVGPEESGAE